jgi:hypothetical protein
MMSNILLSPSEAVVLSHCVVVTAVVGVAVVGCDIVLAADLVGDVIVVACVALQQPVFVEQCQYKEL